MTGAPGEVNNSAYGNFDYQLLGQLVTKLLGATSFESALNTLVLQPLHMTHTRGSRSLFGDQQPGEAQYHMRVFDPNNDWKLYPLEVLQSVRTPGQPLVASQYGNVDYEMFGGAGGLSASVVDMARLAAMFSARDANPLLNPDRIDSLLQACVDAGKKLLDKDGQPSHGYYGLDWAARHDPVNHIDTAEKGGWLPGQGTVLHFTTGGFSYALAINGNADGGTDWLSAIDPIAQSHPWSSADLFHDSYGMPSFPIPKPVWAKPAAPLPRSAHETLALVKNSISRTRAEFTQARPHTS